MINKWNLIPSPPPALPTNSHALYEIVEGEETGEESQLPALSANGHHTNKVHSSRKLPMFRAHFLVYSFRARARLDWRSIV
jgi:hypothetical protein